MRWLGHIGAAAVSAFFIAPIVYMAADREPPVIRHSGEIVPPDPYPGGRISVVWHTTIKRVCPGLVQRRIVDSTGTIWTLGMVEAEYGRSDELIRSFAIPFGIAWGEARYTATVQYRCNVLQDYWPIIVEGPAVRFRVAPPPQPLTNKSAL